MSVSPGTEGTPYPPEPPYPPHPAELAPPPPPRGPGVRVPFAAPPTERDRKRMWVGLSVGGAALVLCCLGGIFGFGALVVVSERELPAQARTVVRDYLDGLAAGDYGRAYDQLCASRRSIESLTAFTERERRYPKITSFTVGKATQVGSRFQVPAEVTGPGGATAERYVVVPETGALRVCGGSR